MHVCASHASPTRGSEGSKGQDTLADRHVRRYTADLLFQVVSRRYEQKSLVITTNLPFKQWDSVFPNAACAVALIDRLTHHAEIISIEGESYRKREAEQAHKRQAGAEAKALTAVRPSEPCRSRFTLS